MSALDHSKIEGANNPEALNIDAQAAKIARKAAEALRQSRAACQVCTSSTLGSK
jgi:DNA excision repair protein ERCC-6